MKYNSSSIYFKKIKNLVNLFFIFLIQPLFSQSGSPANPYYNNFDWNLRGINLKSALSNKIITTHSKSLTYSEAERAIKIVDLSPNDNTNLLLLYGFSTNTCPLAITDDKDHRTRNKSYEDLGNNDNCLWNKEHTFPRALGNPNLGTSGPGSDVHHLRAADKKRNADRDNDKFFNGSGNSFETGSYWYPGDEWKGDVARMMMYMYLRYDTQCLPINVGVGNSVTNDANMIDLFLNWNAEDPVSEFEDKRNDYLGNANNTYGQGNRNPFIDNPYLATLIWGGKVAENRWPNQILDTNKNTFNSEIISIIPNPSINNSINLIIPYNIELNEIQIINIDGKLVKTIKKPLVQNYQYCINEIEVGEYFLKLISTNGSSIKKVIVK